MSRSLTTSENTNAKIEEKTLPQPNSRQPVYRYANLQLPQPQCKRSLTHTFNTPTKELRPKKTDPANLQKEFENINPNPQLKRSFNTLTASTLTQSNLFSECGGKRQKHHHFNNTTTAEVDEKYRALELAEKIDLTK